MPQIFNRWHNKYYKLYFRPYTCNWVRYLSSLPTRTKFAQQKTTCTTNLDILLIESFSNLFSFIDAHISDETCALLAYMCICCLIGKLRKRKLCNNSNIYEKNLFYCVNAYIYIVGMCKKSGCISYIIWYILVCIYIKLISDFPLTGTQSVNMSFMNSFRKYR